MQSPPFEWAGLDSSNEWNMKGMMGCHSGEFCLGCSLSLSGILSLEVASGQPHREAHVIELGNGSSEGCQQPQEGT